MRSRRYSCVISGMSIRGRTNQSSCSFLAKGQENERRTHTREWIARLANSACGRLRLWAVSSPCDQAEATPQYETPGN
jgi:hypothetical protein